MYTAKRGPLGGVIRWAAMRKRLLLLIPTTTYRTEDFMEAAGRLDVDLVVASDRPNVMAGEFPESLLTLPFDDPAAAVAEMRERAARHPLDAVVPVDDLTAVAGAAIAGALGLRANPVGSEAFSPSRRYVHTAWTCVPTVPSSTIGRRTCPFGHDDGIRVPAR